MKVTVHVWDLPLRLFHWSLVVAVTAAYVTAKIGGSWIDWHGRIGALILALLVFRIVWGFVGSTHARFVTFFPTYTRLTAYLRGRWQGIGHNPLGALSVFALLAVMTAQVLTGLFANDDIGFEGPLYPLVDKSLSDRLTGFHSQSFNALLALLVLHVVAIVFYRWVKKTNLVRPMLTGKKEVHKSIATPAFKAGIMRLIVSVLLSGSLTWGVWYGSNYLDDTENHYQTAQIKPSF